MKDRTTIGALTVLIFACLFSLGWVAVQQVAHVEGNQSGDAVSTGSTHQIPEDRGYSIYVRSDTVSASDSLFVHIQESPDGGTTWYEFVGTDTIPGFTADSTEYVFQRSPGHAPLIRLTFDAEGSSIGGISWSYDIWSH